jgi:hypothetical protein
MALKSWERTFPAIRLAAIIIELYWKIPSTEMPAEAITMWLNARLNSPWSA